MKRRIISSSEIPAAYDSLAGDAYNAGYDMEVDDDLNLTFKSREDFFPELQAVKEVIDGNVYYTPVVKFPDLTVSNGDYYDHIEGVIHSWDKVGKFTSQLVRFEYNPEEYEE